MRRLPVATTPSPSLRRAKPSEVCEELNVSSLSRCHKLGENASPRLNQLVRLLFRCDCWCLTVKIHYSSVMYPPILVALYAKPTVLAQLIGHIRASYMLWISFFDQANIAVHDCPVKGRGDEAAPVVDVTLCAPISTPRLLWGGQDIRVVQQIDHFL